MTAADWNLTGAALLDFIAEQRATQRLQAERFRIIDASLTALGAKTIPIAAICNSLRPATRDELATELDRIAPGWRDTPAKETP